MLGSTCGCSRRAGAQQLQNQARCSGVHQVHMHGRTRQPRRAQVARCACMHARAMQWSGERMNACARTAVERRTHARMCMHSSGAENA
jgi:hypothetical protein